MTAKQSPGATVSRQPMRGKPREASLWPGQRYAPSGVHWAKVIECADLDAVTKAVALVLAANWQVRSKTTHPGVTRIATSTRRSVRTVLYCLAQLEDAGLIWCKQRAGQPGAGRSDANVYALTIHDEIAKLALDGFSMPREPVTKAG